MNKTSPLPSVIINPNITNAKAYSGPSRRPDLDLAGARQEKFITPKGVQGSALVYFRIKAEQFHAEGATKLKEHAKLARSLIEEKIHQSTATDEQKTTLLNIASANIRGNIKHSSSEFLSADGLAALRVHRDAPAKLVRFVDAENSEISSSKISVDKKSAGIITNR